MKTAVVYYSFGGKTRALAEAKAQELSAELIEIREAKKRSTFTAFIPGCFQALRQTPVKLAATPSLSGYDSFVFMFPIWAGHPAPAFHSAIKLLPRGAKLSLIMTSSSGSSAEFKPSLIKRLTDLGHPVLDYSDVKTGK